jgi:hypothetical protein
MECAYLFQTNLSKQWIENIRTTKTNFQLILEESKTKLQNAHQCVSMSSDTSTKSLPISKTTLYPASPSLSSSSSVDLPVRQLEQSNGDRVRRSSKVESDVFKIVEQARRNSRTDRKNFGRYFTADGTDTHADNTSVLSSSSSIAPSLSSSSTITKRMSWNNEHLRDKTGQSLITNSFRSVHSSSGVSSTGSFIFSTDEESSIATTTSSSIPTATSDERHSQETIFGASDTSVPSSISNEDDVNTNDSINTHRTHTNMSIPPSTGK